MTGRRKGTPCACEGGSGCGDSCGNKIRKINGISPDPAGAFEVEAGSGRQIEDIENGIRLSTVVDPDDFVTLDTVQEITAKKTFKSELIADNEHSIGGNMTANIDIVMQNEQGIVPTDHSHFGSLRFLDKTGYPDAAINYSIGTSGSKFFSMGWFGDGLGTIDIGRSTATGDIYARAPWRPYNDTNSRDIVTIGMLNTDISIAGAKTWTGIHNWSNPLTVTTVASDCFRQKNSNLPANRATFGTNNIDIGVLSLSNATGDNFSQIEYVETAGSNRNMVLRIFSPTNNAWKGITIRDDGSNSTYVTAPTRTYNSANTNDVVTIGSLAANPNVVHTTGNEDISCTKRFFSFGVKSTSFKYSESPATTVWVNSMLVSDMNNDTAGVIEYGIRQNGNRLFRLRLRAKDGTNVYKTLREMDENGNDVSVIQ